MNLFYHHMTYHTRIVTWYHWSSGSVDPVVEDEKLPSQGEDDKKSLSQLSDQ